ncbi:phage late control D family protein [Gammaproteobacteria bacterium AH-315-C21]|nr:phage late control D family protein [Gammaproteobacteria bacterium AH-315-C21]
MNPAFRIIADNTDITAIIKSQLKMLSITDQAGHESDVAQIQLDDNKNKIALPARGINLAISMGFEGTAAFGRQPGVFNMGRYTVDEVLLGGAPDIMTINAHAADMRKELKTRNDRSWSSITIGDIVKTIAAKHQLKPGIGPGLENIVVPHVDQTDESDLHFLTRLARDYNAVAKLNGGFLLFAIKNAGQSITGAALTPLTIDKSQVSNYSVTLADRNRYESVVAHYQDYETGERISVRAGEGSPSYSIRHPLPDHDRAMAAAQSKLDALRRGASSASLTLKLGMPEIASESPVKLTGFRSGYDADWVIQTARHKIDASSGYTTTVSLETRP